MIVASGKILDKVEQVERWLTDLEGRFSLPIYSSVDIRDSGFKSAVVDTNLFPAGFNNLLLTVTGIRPIALPTLFQVGISPGQILLIIEEHTRNKWYLENVFVLASMLKKAGYPADIALPGFEQIDQYSLNTALGNKLKLTPLKRAMEDTKNTSAFY